MTGLLPDVVRDGIERRSLFEASETFGAVTLVLLVILLVALQTRGTAQRSSGDTTVLAALAVPLLAVVALTILLRVTSLIS